MNKKYCKRFLNILLFLFLSNINSFSFGMNSSISSINIFYIVTVLGVILVIAKISGVIFEKIKLPSMLGEITAGVIISPFLSWKNLFSTSKFLNFNSELITSVIYIFCYMSCIIIFFMVGLDTNYNIFRKSKIKAIFISFFGILFSFLFTSVTLYFLIQTIFKIKIELFSYQILLVTTATIATSSSIAAESLSRKNKINSLEGKTILSASVVDDFFSLLALVFIVTLISSSPTEHPVFSTLFQAAIKIALIFFTALFFGFFIFGKNSFLTNFFRHRSDITLFTFGITMIISGLTENFGLSVLSGSYLSGVALARSNSSSTIKEKIKTLYSFSTSIFFCSVGILTDLSAFKDQRILFFSLIFITAAIIIKIIAVIIPSLFTDFNFIGSLRISLGMIPRGESAIVIGFIGLTLGFIPGSLFTAIVFLVLITGLLNSILTHIFFTNKCGVKKENLEEEPTHFNIEFPSAEIADLILIKLLNLYKIEGFHIRTLNKKEDTHHIKKEESLIIVSRKKSSLYFFCLKKDESFIYTSIYIVMVELEQTIKKISTPLNKEIILKKIQRDTTITKNQFDISQYLSPELIITDLRGQTKEEVIQEMVDLLYRKDIIKDRDEILKSIWEREKIMSTGMQHGVAIPHCRTDSVNDLICVIGIKKTGVDFDSLDNQPAKIIILTISPKNTPMPHVQLMSSIAQRLTKENRDIVINSNSIGEIYNIFVGKISEKKKIDKNQKKETLFIELLKPELMTTSLKSENKNELIDELLDIIKNNEKLDNETKIREALFEREKLVSTGLSDGIAIPHCRTEHVDRVICAIGIKKEGIDFDSLDKKPSYIFILTLIPKERENMYTQFMSMLIKSILNINVEKLTKCKDKKELYDKLISEISKH